MTNRYLPGLVRFGATVLAGGILLKLLVLRFPTDVISRVGMHYRATLGDLVHDSLLGAIAIGARGLAISLPLAMVLGIWAGLRPRTRLDRGLRLPLGLLAGLPALPAVLALVCALVLDLGWMATGGALYLALALVTWPCLTLAIRNAIASIADEGQGVHAARAFTALFGAVLSQSGNIAAGSLAIGAYLTPDTGLLRLLELTSRMRDPALLYTLLVPSVLLVALLHLAGDSLTAFAGGNAGTPSQPVPKAWVAAGTFLALVGLAAFGLNWYAAANTWLIAGGALLIAGVAGVLLAAAGGELLPRLALPSFIAPLMAGLIFPVLWGESLRVQVLALGLAGAPMLARSLRRVLSAADADRRPALAGLGGAVLLALGQTFGTQVALGILNAGVPTDLPNLGALVRTTLLADGATQYYGPVLLALATAAGLSLLGLSLQERAGDPSAHAPEQPSAIISTPA